MTTTRPVSRLVYVRTPRQTSRAARAAAEPLDLRTPSGRRTLPY